MLIASLPLSAGGRGDAVTAPTGFLRKVGTFLDSMAVNGLDRRFIEAPARPWQVILRGNINQSDLKLSSITNNAEELLEFMQDGMKWGPRMKTVPASYAGIWTGYRGYGLGYSWNVGGDKGRIFTLGATGGSYGVNLRIHWFDNDEPEVFLEGSVLIDETDEGEPVFMPISFTEEVELESPVKNYSLFLDGYYLFNGKECSYAAAYDQSVVQKRSAGSLMAGAMYFHSTTSYDTDTNADLILLMNDVGRFKSWQLSSGIGYIYNWVPAKGLLVSGMAIPMLTFYSYNKMWRFDSSLKDAILANGFSEWLDMGEEDYKISEASQDPIIGKHSKMKINIDARLSVTYEWKNRFFINAFGQFSSFRYEMDNISGRFNDWYVNASVGVRL